MIERIEITSEAQWLALRKKDVTASVAGALLGVHEYTTAYSLWAQKTGALPDEDRAEHVSSGQETTFVVSDLERGKLLEPVAIELVRSARPTWKITQPQAYFRDPDCRLGATPDAIAIDPSRTGSGVVQIKTVSEHAYRRKWRDPDTGEITLPLWIAVQAAIEAELTGSTWACVGAMVVDHKLTMHLIEIPLSKALIQRVREEVAGFWALIAAGGTPSPDYARDARLLARVLAEDDGEEIDLSGDNRLAELIAERMTISARASEDDKTLKAINAEILSKMGNSAVARCGAATITAKTVRRKEYVAKASTYRAIRIKIEGSAHVE